MTEKTRLTIYIHPDTVRRLKVMAAERNESLSALVERALRKEVGNMESRDEFARHLGYASWDDLMAASETVAVEGDISWYITRLPDGRWAAWDDAEIAADRVTVHDSRNAALLHQWECWCDSADWEPEDERFRWAAEPPEGHSLSDVLETVNNLACDLLDEGGTPLTAVEAYEMGGDRLAARVTWYTTPEPLVEDDDPPLVHPRWRGTNCNWRSAAPAWNERRAKVWGEVIAGRHWFAVVGEEDPRPHSRR